MHRSSDSIGSIAAALAKAQIGLINPEKTMTATIRDERRGQGSARSFRYAPLATGLDLVRKALGQHQIAVVQTTALDKSTRTVRLNTLLAHSSGEWIASDWPVCAMSDMNTPQRMGAALTYARRYGLFTLVGIAGEDDLDAPDLNIVSVEPENSKVSDSQNPAGAQPSHLALARAGEGPQRKPLRPATRPILAPEESARLRQGMLAEIESMGSSAAAAAWAQTMLRAKNTLIADDARSVETAFEAKLAELEGDVAADQTAPKELMPMHQGVPADGPGLDPGVGIAGAPSSNERDQSDRKPPMTRTLRHRNKEHLKFIRAQPCLVCAKQPSDAHHLSFAQPRALGRKVSDEFAVPLCRAHHRELHRAAKEVRWWQPHGIAPLAEAEALWQRSLSGQALSETPGPLSEPPQNQSS